VGLKKKLQLQHRESKLNRMRNQNIMREPRPEPVAGEAQPHYMKARISLEQRLRFRPDAHTIRDDPIYQDTGRSNWLFSQS